MYQNMKVIKFGFILNKIPNNFNPIIQLMIIQNNTTQQA